MNRDTKLFSRNETGDALWRMQSGGDDLSKPREIDFFVIFPTEQAALQFAILFLRKKYKVSMSPYERGESFSWQIGIHPILIPTYVNVVALEDLLATEAEILDGKNDGWGCFEQS